MKLTEAIQLIKPGFHRDATKETWADFGSGSGLFTKALASLLGSASVIYAVDKEIQQVNAGDENDVAIEFIKLDFIHDSIPFSNLDGILMANALHYVKDKNSFIEKLKSHMKPHGRFIIVEYDTERANGWVPYPINFERLTAIFSAHGFANIKKIGERNSIYRSDGMYACVVERRCN
jgi:ubiquinone/menaquinone biosynthesis C-methylase UbiE